MNTPGAPGDSPGQVNLQTLVSVIQNAVQAQYLIAENIAALTTAQEASTAAIAAAFPPPLTSSATWNPPSLVSGASESTTIAVTGAALGNIVEASFNLDLQGLTLIGYVSSANTVTVVLSNLTGGTIDLASGTLKVRVVTN